MEREGIFSLIKATILKAWDAAFVSVQSQLIYNQPFTFTDPQSIPDLATVMAMLGSGIARTTFTDADLIADGFGGFKLPFAISSPEIPLMIRVETASSDRNLNVIFDNDDLFGFEDPTMGTQTIYVFSTGVYVPPSPPPPAPVFSLQPVTPLTIIQNNTLSLSVSASDTVSYQWYKDGVALSGQTASTLNVTFFGASDAGTYKAQAIGSGGVTDSANSVVTYDAGILLFNLSDTRNDNSPNGAGRSITYDDGVFIKTIIVGSFEYIGSSTTSLEITQAGSDDLTLYDGVHTFAPILGGSVSNIFVPPFGVLEVHNNN